MLPKRDYNYTLKDLSSVLKRDITCLENVRKLFERLTNAKDGAFSVQSLQNNKTSGLFDVKKPVNEISLKIFTWESLQGISVRPIDKHSSPVYLQEPSTSIPKPSTYVPKPSISVPKPSKSVPKPSTSIPKPSTSVPKPSTSIPKPSTSIPKPSTSIPKPSQLNLNKDLKNTSNTAGAKRKKVSQFHSYYYNRKFPGKSRLLQRSNVPWYVIRKQSKEVTQTYST